MVLLKVIFRGNVLYLSEVLETSDGRNQKIDYPILQSNPRFRIHATDTQKISDLDEYLGITITNGVSDWLDMKTLKIIGSKPGIQEVKTIVDLIP